MATEDRDCDITVVHLKYWIFILLLVVIAVATDRWTGQENFTQYLSNAATMASLVLALVAIVYSFIANDGLSKSLGNIGVVSEEVRKSKDAIGDFLEETREATSKGEENKIALADISKTLEINLSALQHALETVATQTEALPHRFDKLETSFNQAAKNLGTKTNTTDNAAPLAKSWSEADVNIMCKRLPLAGNLFVYACVLAKNGKKLLDMTELDKALEGTFSVFNTTLLQGLHATQVIERKLVLPTKSYEITKVDAGLEKVSRSYFVEYVTITYEEGSADRILWMKRLAGIEALYGVIP